MKKSFLKLFGSSSKSVPDNLQNELHKHFPNAINIDWEPKKNSYEAIFYVDEVEHIAKISEDGALTEVKKNLWPSELPEDIAIKSREWGEIMNSIVITRSNTRLFEVIIKDNTFKRRMLLFDASANLLNSEKL